MPISGVGTAHQRRKHKAEKELKKLGKAEHKHLQKQKTRVVAPQRNYHHGTRKNSRKRQKRQKPLPKNRIFVAMPTWKYLLPASDPMILPIPFY